MSMYEAERQLEVRLTGQVYMHNVNKNMSLNACIEVASGGRNVMSRRRGKKPVWFCVSPYKLNKKHLYMKLVPGLTVIPLP